MKQTYFSFTHFARYALPTILALSALVAIVSPFAQFAHAADCSGTDTVIVECGKYEGKNVNGVWSILLIVLNILTAGVGIVAVGAIAYAAYLYASAADNESQVTKSRSIITNSIVGIVSFALMYSFLQYIIPGGAFGDGGPMLASTSSAKKSPTASAGSSNGSGSSADSASGSGSSSGNAAATETLSTNFVGVSNFRDAGASGVLKQGIIYRSARLHDATTSDVRTLSRLLDNGTIIDFRADSERARMPDKSIPGTTKANFPMPGTLNYLEFVDEPVDRRAFGSAMRLIARTDGDVLIHCTAGKDRTGWLVAMLMHVSGASNQQIMNEYMKSASYQTVKREWLNVGLSRAREKYGSVDNYIRNGLGVSDATVQQLRARIKA